MGGGNGGPGNPSGGTNHGGSGGSGGIGANGPAAWGQSGGSGSGGHMWGGVGGGAIERHHTGQAVSQLGITVRTSTGHASDTSDLWYTLQSGSGGMGASAHAHGAVDALNTNTEWQGYGGSAGANNDAGFYLRFVTDETA